MSVRPCAHYQTRAYDSKTAEPTLADVGPGYEPPTVPSQPGAQGEEWLASVAVFPKRPDRTSSLEGPLRGVLWGARIDSLAIRDSQSGGNELTLSVPATVEAMRVWGDPIAGAVGDGGRPLYSTKNSISRVIGIGSSLDGKVRWYFFVRGPVEIQGGRLVINAKGIVGGLIGDRIIGAPTRTNLLGANSSFEAGNLSGWAAVGDCTATLTAGGVDGEFCVGVTGTPNGRNYLEARRVISYGEGVPYGRGERAGVAWVKLPTIGPEIDDARLVTVAVVDAGGDYVWPPLGIDDADPEAGAVTSDMKRGEWLPDQVVAIGYTDQPPFTASLRIRLHPVSTSEPVFYDGCALMGYDVTGTGFEVDRVHHIAKLMHDAQFGEGKTNWRSHTTIGELSGVVEGGVWPHEDRTPLYEAMEAVVGVEYWDEPQPGGGWGIKVSKRRGSVRGDVQVHTWDVIGKIDWKVDPGGQRTVAIGQSAAGSLWGGADVGAVDKSLANGQAIDVLLTGPAGMTPIHLSEWTVQQLSTLKILPGSTTLMLRWDLAMRLTVGDTVLVAVEGSEGAAHLDWMRVNQWVPDLIGCQWVAVSFGTDVDAGMD